MIYPKTLFELSRLLYCHLCLFIILRIPWYFLDQSGNGRSISHRVTGAYWVDGFHASACKSGPLKPLPIGSIVVPS